MGGCRSAWRFGVFSSKQPPNSQLCSPPSNLGLPLLYGSCQQPGAGFRNVRAAITTMAATTPGATKGWRWRFVTAKCGTYDSGTVAVRSFLGPSCY